MKKELLSIGKIVKTQGLKGQLKIILNPRIEISQPLILEVLFYEFKKVILPLQVENFLWENNYLIIKFKKLNNINDVQFLINCEIFINQENSSFNLKADWKEYLVKTQFGDSVVLETMNNGAQDLIKVKIKQKEFWVPLVEIYLENIDQKNKYLFLKNLEELM